jgi:peptide alpha-N-acetyltransferase
MSALDTKTSLPARESGIFRSIVKFYETKQYKKGLKSSETILKKFPEHGETLAMKGLTLNCLKRKEEAYDFVRRGVKNDLKSHVCWHVFGLLHRSDQNYNEAIKCYRNALRIDKDNLQILRDLSLLQVQMRDGKGFCETRRQLLTLKPNNRNNWVGFSIAQHLDSNRDTAINILDAYIKTMETDKSPNYEDSELMLYRNQLIEEQDQYDTALAHLEECKHMVVDRLYWQQVKGRLLLKLEKYEEAAVEYKALIDINPEHYHYHVGLQCATLKTGEYITFKGCDTPASIIELTAEQNAEFTAIYADLHKQYPRSSAIKRIPLNFLSGDAFRNALEVYVKRALQKGVPSLGSDLKQLYKVKGAAKVDIAVAKANERVKIIEELVTGYISSLEETQRFPGTAADSKLEPPTALLWSWALLAHHFDRLGEYGQAIEIIEKCLKHTPTAVDLYQLKGKFLKHAGDVVAAAEVLEEGRVLDLADRYINNKSCKYSMRADLLEQADETVALFTRHEGEQDAQANLFDMQCMWFELCCGDSHFRSKNYGKALKKFSAVEKHFADFQEDQFDFHTYCVRKMTIRSYVQMLRLEDKLWGHSFYTRAAKAAIECYLCLYDNPQKKSEESTEADYAAMTPADRKKAKAKARKETAKKNKEKFKKEAAAAASKEMEKEDKDKKKKGGGQKKDTPVDEDPDGEKLAAKDPMEECTRIGKVSQRRPWSTHSATASDPCNPIRQPPQPWSTVDTTIQRNDLPASYMRDTNVCVISCANFSSSHPPPSGCSSTPLTTHGRTC